MNAKNWVFLCLLTALIMLAFFQRDMIEIVYLRGNEVVFPGLKKTQKNEVSIFVVGSEGTLHTDLVNRISKECPKMSLYTKVNRFTNFEWQEGKELHRFIREGKFDIVLIEASTIDFSEASLDRIARFESSAKKSSSQLFFWSTDSPQNYPRNFLGNLPKNLADLCSLPLPLSGI